MIEKPSYEELAQKIVALEKEVAKHKQPEEALRESEARYRGIFEYTKNGVAVYKAVNDGEDFIFLDFNQAGERIDSLKREELIGQSVLEIFHGIKDLGLFEVLQRVWRTGHPEHHPTNIYQDERLVGWRENFVYKLPSGEIVAIYSDETERKQAENRLRESEARFRALTESAPSSIFIFHSKRFLYVNPAFEALSGFSKAEIFQMRFWDLIHPEMRELIRKRGLARQRGEDVPARYEVKILTKDGKTNLQSTTTSHPPKFRLPLSSKKVKQQRILRICSINPPMQLTFTAIISEKKSAFKIRRPISDPTSYPLNNTVLMRLQTP